VTHPLTQVTPAEPPPRRTPYALSVLIVVSLLVLAWAAAWSQRTPEVLDMRSSALSVEPGPGRGPFHFAVVPPATSGIVADVSLVELRPVVVRNTADATISFVVCSARAGKTEGLGAVVGPLDEWCTRTRAAKDTRLRVAGEYVVMTIAPEQAGTVRVSAVEVTYRNGWQLLWLPRTVTVPVSARVKVT
jgi:hypothetical protein